MLECIALCLVEGSWWALQVLTTRTIRSSTDNGVESILAATLEYRHPGSMTFAQRFSLFWRRFSPLEEQLFAAVREILPRPAQPVFDAQVSGINLVQRHPDWVEISFYRRRRGKVDWSDIARFPRPGEFRLAEVQFSVAGQRYKATLTSISGHIFDFTITPGPRAVGFDRWDAAPTTRLLADPLAPEADWKPEPIPAEWRAFINGQTKQSSDGWTFHDERTAFRRALAEGEFLVLAEREGDEFVLHRIEPPASPLFYLASHDGSPEPLKGTIESIFQPEGAQNR